MPIPREEVLRVAALARLEIDAAELDRVAQQLSSVIEFAAQIDSLDLTGCEPTAFAPPHAALRRDAPDGRQLDVERATSSAPEAEDGHFLVPPIVEHPEP